MSDLISTPPSPASPMGSLVGAGDWYPAVDCNDLRDEVRLGENIVPHKRLVAAIHGAILHAARQLQDWQRAQRAAGVEALFALPDPDAIVIDGIPRAVLLWRRIVRYYAAAEIADGHRDLVAADQQAQRGDERRVSADDYRRMGHAAIADLRSIGADTPVQRNHVELL